jgi:hypothetical protein
MKEYVITVKQIPAPDFEEKIFEYSTRSENVLIKADIDAYAEGKSALEDALAYMRSIQIMSELKVGDGREQIIGADVEPPAK